MLNYVLDAGAYWTDSEGRVGDRYAPEMVEGADPLEDGAAVKA